MIACVCLFVYIACEVRNYEQLCKEECGAKRQSETTNCRRVYIYPKATEIQKLSVMYIASLRCSLGDFVGA